MTEEMSGMHWVDRTETVAKRIAARNECATKVVRIISVSGSGRRSGVVFGLTPLGKAIWELCREAVPLMEQLYPGCCREERRPCQPVGSTPVLKEIEPSDEVRTNFNPHITVMLRACQSLRSMLSRHGGATLDVNQRFARAAIEQMVRFVRRVCRSKRFKYLAGNYTRNEQEGFRSCCQYMASTFARLSKLLIMRVDLYVLPGHKGWANSREAAKSVLRFRRALREGRIVKDVEAWVCRRENGFRRGIHLHVLVAVNGHKHQHAAALSRIIGEKWVAKYSDRKGSYFNCYVRKDWYRFNGLGSVHIRNHEKLLGIREAFRYMTKGACHVTTGFKRNLWRGNMDKSCESVKLGAPRKAEHDMALVNEILWDV